MKNPDDVHSEEPAANASHALAAEGSMKMRGDELQPLSDGYVALERLMGYIIGGIVLLVAVSSSSSIFFLGDGSWWIIALVLGCWVGLAALLFYFAQFHPQLVYNHTRWRMNDEGFEIQRGIFWRHRIAIPAARVQHVDVSQGPFQRMYKLGTLTIHTAGTKNASVELSGLDHSLALGVRDDLITQKELLDDAG